MRAWLHRERRLAALDALARGIGEIDAEQGLDGSAEGVVRADAIDIVHVLYGATNYESILFAAD